jgi:hypothetical protein
LRHHYEEASVIVVCSAHYGNSQARRMDSLSKVHYVKRGHMPFNLPHVYQGSANGTLWKKSMNFLPSLMQLFEIYGAFEGEFDNTDIRPQFYSKWHRIFLCPTINRRKSSLKVLTSFLYIKSHANTCKCLISKELQGITAS